jgi:hypothetical protein
MTALVARRALAAIVALLVLAGCAGIPLDGPVRSVEVGTDEGGGDLVTIAEGPLPGATPEQLINGFLTAQRAPARDYSIARDFLTEEFRTTWSPTSGVLITSSAVPPTSSSENSFALSVNVVAVVNSTGNYRELQRAESQQLDYRLELDSEGEWRIAEAPQGTVLSASQFASTFAPYPLYFYEPQGRYLVPDVRWFPATASRANRIVTELLRGQSPWYANGVLVTAFPADTKLDQGVQIAGGTASVDLSNVVAGASRTEQFRMQQQLVASLALSDVSNVQITVGGLPLDIGTGEIPEWVLSVPSGVVGDVDGAFGAVSGAGVQRLPGISDRVVSLDLTGATIARGGAAATVRTPQGVWSLPQAQDDTILVDTRPGLTDPSIDGLGYIWSAQSSPADSIIAFEPDGTPHAIPAPYLDGSIVSLDVSRDGARLLIAAQGSDGPTVLMVGVLRDGAGVPVALGEPLELAVGSRPLVDATWVDASTIATLSTAASATTVDLYRIGGRHEALGSLQNGVQIVGGNMVEGLRVRDSDGRVWRHSSSGGWQATALVVSFLATQQ